MPIKLRCVKSLNIICFLSYRYVNVLGIIQLSSAARMCLLSCAVSEGILQPVTYQYSQFSIS